MSLLTDLLPHVYAATVITPVGSADPKNAASATGLIDTATTKVITLLFLIGGILAVIYLLWSGITYITAGGNMDRAKVARQGIINAVIGVIVMMGSFAIIRFAVTAGLFVANSGKGTTSGSTTNSSGTTGSSGSSTGSATSSVNSSGTGGSTTNGNPGNCVTQDCTAP